MLDIAPTEFLLVALVALVVIGPKDLPRVMRVVGRWVGRARGVARQFRSGFDEMVRQAELEEMEKKWAAENERIMREHPVESGNEDVKPRYDATGHPEGEEDERGFAEPPAVMLPLPANVHNSASVPIDTATATATSSVRPSNGAAPGA